MVRNAAQIYDEIQQLTAGERARLLSNLKFQENNANTHDFSREEQCVFDALMQLSGVRIPKNKFLEKYGTKKFSGSVQELYGFIDSYRRFLRQPQINGLAFLCLRCLAQDLRRRELPVTPKVLLDNLSILPYAVDRAFPGYMRAGMLHKVVGAVQAA